MAATFDVAKVLPSLLPREFDGKNAQEGLAFLSGAILYYTTAVAVGMPSNLAWMVLLNRLTGDAASWAGPHMWKRPLQQLGQML